jgi:hypothetical protein
VRPAAIFCAPRIILCLCCSAERRTAAARPHKSMAS